jgi:hypothetical protein
MITPYTIDTIIYRHELAYFKGKSLADFRERKDRRIWAHIQRWFTMWSVLAVAFIQALPVHTFA